MMGYFWEILLLNIFGINIGIWAIVYVIKKKGKPDIDEENFRYLVPRYLGQIADAEADRNVLLKERVKK